jgi:hypothetical protein
MQGVDLSEKDEKAAKPLVERERARDDLRLLLRAFGVKIF